MPTNQENNKRILKNSLFLYMRLLLTLVIGLYTSRVILRTLGVEDYGVYNVVAGFVSMFSLLTGSLSNSISRFLTYTLGKGDLDRLKLVFSTSVLIQIVLAVLIIVTLEVLGLWFLNTQLKIPEGRLSAANWVFHLSVLSFAINLISVPYNAAIIAHEKMNAFAYIGILETMLKLLIVFLLMVSPFDKLIVYAILFVMVSVFIRAVYGWYCKRNFKECRLSFVFDKKMVKEMTGFAGWNMLGNASSILGNQGANIVMNLFFGVVVNAARGVTNQVEGIVKQFVSNITTAINPQITKSYAEGNFDYMNVLVRKSAKYSICLILLFAVPFWFETETLLGLWLGDYPEYAPVFLRLSLLGVLIDMSGNSLAIAVWASGNVRRYYIYIGSVGLLVLPITYVFFKLGFPPFFAYVAYIAIYGIIQIIRLFIAKKEIPFEMCLYVKEVYFRCIVVMLSSIAIPLALYVLVDWEGLVKSALIIVVVEISVVMATYGIGFDSEEKKFVRNKLSHLFRKK